MLVLSRHKSGVIRINDNIKIHLVEIRGDKVRIGIDAPESVAVHREEVYQAIQREKSKKQLAKEAGLSGGTQLTNHVEFAAPVPVRPANLPRITEADLCKAKHRDGDMMCYTGWLLDIFLQEGDQYVAAYKQFRLKTMDVLFGRYSDDHAVTATQRASVFNEVAESLGYEQVPTQQWLYDNREAKPCTRHSS